VLERYYHEQQRNNPAITVQDMSGKNEITMVQLNDSKDSLQESDHVKENAQKSHARALSQGGLSIKSF